MAPAAYETITAHFSDTGRCYTDYDAIVTGDLGRLGSELLRDLFLRDGVDLDARYMDCGVLIFAGEAQDTHCGGSGCGCSASVFAGHLLEGMRGGRWPRLLFCATGALMSQTMSQQGETIPGICHCVALDMKGRL
jgi:stage V sporulation protein AD